MEYTELVFVVGQFGRPELIGPVAPVISPEMVAVVADPDIFI